jgi:hypothetical protein
VATNRTPIVERVPNPFNPTTTIRFDLARDSHVELQIFDVSGRRVRRLVDANLGAARGIAEIWNGMNDGGHRVTSGVYLYRLTAGDFSATRKMIVLE